MALSKLDSLYMAVVADHAKHPHHHGLLAGVEALQLNNPTCGDVVLLSLKLEEDRITDIGFAGEGCTISTASTSMMTDAVLGKTKAEALAMAAQFSDLVQGQPVAGSDALGDASFMAGVAKFPQRVKCATLGWNALKAVLARAEEGALD